MLTYTRTFGQEERPCCKQPDYLLRLLPSWEMNWHNPTDQSLGFTAQSTMGEDCAITIIKRY